MGAQSLSMEEERRAHLKSLGLGRGGRAGRGTGEDSLEGPDELAGGAAGVEAAAKGEGRAEEVGGGLVACDGLRHDGGTTSEPLPLFSASPPLSHVYQTRPDHHKTHTNTPNFNFTALLSSRGGTLTP